MPLARVIFATQSYQDESLPISAQQLINCYWRPNPPGSKSPGTIYGTPGLRPWIAAGQLTGPCRGLHYAQPYLYVVSGGYLYKISSTKTITRLGMISGTQTCHMAHNLNQVIVVAEHDIFLWDESTSTFSMVSQSDCNGVGYLDGYFVLSRKQGGRFFISDLNDGLSYQPLAYATAESDRDDIVGLIIDHRTVYLGGLRTMETWVDAGDADFPLARLPGGIYERGIASSWCMDKANSAVFLLGDDGRAYKIEGFAPTAISTPPIDSHIRPFTDKASAQSFAYSQNGHTFYVLSFSGATFVYDVSTGRWHERKSLGMNRWRAQCHEQCFDSDIVGDVATDALYQLDLGYYLDGADPIHRTIVSSPINAEGHRSVMSRFFVDMEGGVGLETGQGSAPQIMLQWSDDGGRVWSNEHWTSQGGVGEYGRRVTWNRLGMFRQRSMRVHQSDPVKFAVADAYVQLEARL